MIARAILALLLIFIFTSLLHHGSAQTTQNIKMCKYIHREIESFIYVATSINELIILLFVVYVNEESNAVADKAVDVAMTYITKNPKLGVQVDIQKVIGNRTDAKGLLESCKTIHITRNTYTYICTI